MKRDGILFVISAPSGTGKTTVCHRLIDIFPTLRHSVSYTTRPPREGEMDGRDYYFVDTATFQRMVDDGGFAEWAEVHGNYYGTALATLEQARQSGTDILLDIDIQGARQIRQRIDNAVLIFLLPPDMEELRHRLQGRDSDESDVIERRLANARQEIPAANWYDYWVVNEELDEAVRDVSAIVRAEACRGGRKQINLKAYYGLEAPEGDE